MTELPRKPRRCASCGHESRLDNDGCCVECDQLLQGATDPIRLAVEYVPAPPGKHVLVTMPDGYRVWPDEDNEPDVYFCLVVRGRGEHGEPVTVRGTHIARVQPAISWPKPT